MEFGGVRFRSQDIHVQVSEVFTQRAAPLESAARQGSRSQEPGVCLDQGGRLGTEGFPDGRVVTGRLACSDSQKSQSTNQRAPSSTGVVGSSRTPSTVSEEAGRLAAWLHGGASGARFWFASCLLRPAHQLVAQPQPPLASA